MHSRFSFHSYKLILVLSSSSYCSLKCCEHERWNMNVFKIFFKHWTAYIYIHFFIEFKALFWKLYISKCPKNMNNICIVININFSMLCFFLRKVFILLFLRFWNFFSAENFCIQLKWWIPAVSEYQVSRV